MTQMAGERLFELLALAEQQNADVKGKGGLVVNPFEQAESGGITNKVFDKSLNKEGGFKPPLPGVDMDIREILRRNEEKFKADTSLGGALAGIAFGSPVTASGQVIKDLEVEGFDSVPEHLRNKLREMEWKKQYELDQQLGLEPRVY